MKKTLFAGLALGLAALFAASQMAAQDGKPVGKPADFELRALAAEYSAAFAKGDPKALAAFWTENGEFRSDDGETLIGRAAIEKAYAEQFKEHPKSKVSFDIRNIRYPGRDIAIQDGTLQASDASAAPPTTSYYQALYVREDGKWKLAIVHEWGAGLDKLQDLNWLIGAWTAKTKERDVTMTFEWNPKRTCILSKFTATQGGKTVTGTQRITQDPNSGLIRAFSSDSLGGHTTAVWSRDGDRWVAEVTGVTPDGAETTAVNAITRIGEDAFLWRSVNRTVSGVPTPDTAPVKLTRSK